MPGKFEVLARVPQRRLKTVVLPVLGFPISATRGRRSVAMSVWTARGRRALRTAERSRDDHRSRGACGISYAAASGMTRMPRASSRDNLDPGRAHLHDAGFARLADPEQVSGSQSQRIQQGTILTAELRGMQARDGAGAQLRQVVLRATSRSRGRGRPGRRRSRGAAEQLVSRRSSENLVEAIGLLQRRRRCPVRDP